MVPRSVQRTKAAFEVISNYSKVDQWVIRKVDLTNKSLLRSPMNPATYYSPIEEVILAGVMFQGV